MHRSTTLRAGRRHCPAAVVHHRIGTHYDREIFDMGICAHALIEAAYHGHPAPFRSSVDAAVPAILSKGVRFEGELRGPYLPDDVMTARDLALRWLDREPPVDRAKAEGGIAVDADWRIVPYQSEDVRWSGIVDLSERWDDFDQDRHEEIRVLRITDWKTSWQDKEPWLDSVQARGNALLALAKAEDDGYEADVLITRIVNLRIPWDWERQYQLRDPAVRDEIEEWREQLDLSMEGLDDLGDDPEAVARPGTGCFATEAGCPFRERCEAAEKVYGSTLEDPRSMALRWISAKALTAASSPLTKAVRAAAEGQPIELPDGRFLGHGPRARREPSANAHMLLVEAVARIGGELGEGAAGLLKMVGPGVGQIETVLKTLRRSHPQLRDEWNRIEELAIEDGRVVVFGAMNYPPPVESPPLDETIAAIQESIDRKAKARGDLGKKGGSK